MKERNILLEWWLNPFLCITSKTITTQRHHKTIGSHFLFWILNSSEKLYFKTGLLFTELSDYKFLQVPILFERVYLMGVVSPKFDAGVKRHFGRKEGFSLTAFASAGCLIKVSEWIYFNMDVSSDLFHMFFDDNFFMSCAGRTGVHIRINN